MFFREITEKCSAHRELPELTKILRDISQPKYSSSILTIGSGQQRSAKPNTRKKFYSFEAKNKRLLFSKKKKKWNQN